MNDFSGQATANNQDGAQFDTRGETGMGPGETLGKWKRRSVGEWERGSVELEVKNKIDREKAFCSFGVKTRTRLAL